MIDRNFIFAENIKR